MFCEQCGIKLTEGSLFCPNCGAKVFSNGMEYEDDDKTVILHEETDFREEEQREDNSDTAGTSEPTSTVPEIVETVEISPTGVVETGTAVAVPEAVSQKKFCPNCGAANGMNDLFCQQCGMFFGNAAEKMGTEAASGKVRKGKNVWKIAAAAVAVLAVIGLAIVAVPRILGCMTAKEKDFVMYLKGNELTIARKNKYEPVVIGDRTFADRDESSSVSGYIYVLSHIQYSSDYQYVYYPQKVDDDGCDLYQRRLNGNKTEAVKIDSGVVEYYVVDNDKVVYVKDNNDRKLYLYHDGNTEKIASYAWDLGVSADGKYVMWRDEDDRLYVQDTALKAGKMKLESDVYDIYAVSDNFDTIVYRKEDKLYVMKGMNEKEKIASDVCRAYVYDINGKLKMYYLKEGDEVGISYYDLIEDDCLSQDQQMAEPRIEDYQRVTYKDSFWGMQESIEVSDDYYEELDKYLDKLLRDRQRTSLENDIPALKEYDIYYYEEAAGESNKVMTALLKQGELNYGSPAVNSALMYIYNIDQENIDKPKLSELQYEAVPAGSVTNMDDVLTILSGMGSVDLAEEEIMRQLVRDRQLQYIENGEVHEIEGYEAGDDYLGTYIEVWANEDKHILYIKDRDGEDERLYSYDYGRKDASLELITDELMQVQMASYDMDEICYINTNGELYYGDTMIAEDCAGGSAFEDGTILYMTDMDKNGEEGTFRIYRNGKDTKVADDVAPQVGSGALDSDHIFFLTDYNFKKYRGDLNVYDGKNVKKIDTDVTWIIN